MALSQHDLQCFEALLKKQKLQLLNEAAGDASATVELDQSRVGRVSRMDAMQAQAMSVETGRRRRQQLTEIDSALERIERGEYGDCFDCGELISPGRLEANPSVKLCIDCAQARE